MEFRSKKIVCFGGGTGLPALLSGLKNNPWLKITAIVSMFDSGGSSGELRDRFGILPPGDILKCLLALSSNERVAREILLKRIQRQKFASHNSGNILLMGLEEVYGNYLEAVKALGEILAITGKVVPVTLESSALCAQFSDDAIACGETKVDDGVFAGKEVIKLYLNPMVEASPEALNEIKEADVLCIGPGSFYTSVLPNFLPEKIQEAIMASGAPIIFNANLVCESTRQESLSGVIATLEKHLGRKVSQVTVNTSEISPALREEYAREQKIPLLPTASDAEDRRIIQADLLVEGEIARHDSAKLASLIAAIIARSNGSRH